MSKLSELLTQIDAAFEVMEARVADELTIRAAGAAAVSKASAELETVKQDHGQRVTNAEQAVSQARIALNKLRDQVNERVGAVTTNDARVSVR